MTVIDREPEAVRRALLQFTVPSKRMPEQPVVYPFGKQRTAPFSATTASTNPRSPTACPRVVSVARR
jgi:hypothetical protein